MAQRPPRLWAVKMAPLSVSRAAGKPNWPAAAWRTSTTSRALVVRKAWEAASSREWSSTMLSTSTSVPSARDQWVVPACQSSLGSSAFEHPPDGAGRGHRPPGPALAPPLQVVADGVRPGVQALFGQGLPKRDYLVFHLRADP